MRRDHFRREFEVCQRGLCRGGERLDIDGIIIVGRGDAQRRLITKACEHAEQLVADGRRSRRAVLRVERDDDERRSEPLSRKERFVTRSAIDGVA